MAEALIDRSDDQGTNGDGCVEDDFLLMVCGFTGRQCRSPLFLRYCDRWWLAC